jgi:hypothetical protein
MASRSKPDSTSITIASAALDAMYQPISETVTTTERFSGPSRRKVVLSGVASSTVIDQSAGVVGATPTTGEPASVATGMRLRSASSRPQALSTVTTPRRARSGSKRSALASKYSRRSV